MTTPVLTPAKAHASTLTKLARPVVQRKCDCGAAAKAGAKCPECEEKTKTGVVQRSASGPESVGEVPSIVHDVLRSPGQPLDRETRDFFEPRFGADFSRVRVHTDGQAAQSAAEISALAYTAGDQIAFAAGNYNPSSAAGKRLLAHELTHVVQQSAFHNESPTALIADENSAHEREADLSADALLSGNPLHAINRFGSPAIQRKAGSPSAPKPGAAGGCGLCYKNEQEDGKVQPFQLQIGRDAHTQVQEAFVISYPNIVSLHEQGVRADEPTGKSKKGKSTTSVDEKLFGTVGFPDLFMISTSPLDVAVDAPTEGYTPVYFYGEIKPDNPQGIKDGSDKLQKYKEILVTNKKYNAKPLVPRPD